jgi:hypothetical protein
MHKAVEQYGALRDSLPVNQLTKNKKKWDNNNRSTAEGSCSRPFR